MNNSKKLLSVLLSLVMILSTMSCLGAVSFAADDSMNYAAASSSTDLFSAQKAAVAELGAARTNENSTILANAITAILSATSVEQVNSIKAQALLDMTAADSLAKAKEDAIAAINAAKTNTNEILTYDAIKDINNAETIEKVNAIKEKTLEAMAKADREVNARNIEILFGNDVKDDYFVLGEDTYTDIKGLRISNIGDFNFIYINGSSSNINFENLQGVGDGIYSFSVADGGKITKIVATSSEKWYPDYAGDNWKNETDIFGNFISTWTNEDGQDVVYFDATDCSPVRKLVVTYYPLSELEKAKADTIKELNAVKTEENADIIDSAIARIEFAKTVMEVKNIKVEVLGASAGHSDPEVDRAKEDAINAIENAMTDANGSIAHIAIADIKCSFSVSEINSIKDKALSDMAKADAEAALAEAKNAAIAEINAVKNDYNKSIAEAAITDIESAESADDIEFIKVQALADIIKVDAANLSLAKSDAIAELTKFAGEEPSISVRQYLGLAARDISIAKSISDVIGIRENAKARIASLAEQDFADSLELKKLAAIAQLEEVAGDKDSRSEKLQWEVETGIFMINLSYSEEKVTEMLNAALGYIATQKERDSAIAEVKALCGETSSEAVKAIFDEFCEKVEYAVDDEIATLKAEYIVKITAQIESEKSDEPSKGCGHLCHKGGFLGFIWKIVNIFNKLFRTNKVCKCGASHY